MITLRPLSSWSLKTKLALCSGALMFAFSVAFTTWTLHTVEADVHASVVDSQLALVRSTADDVDAKVELRRDALTTIAPLLAQAAPRTGADMDEFFRARPVLRKMFDAVIVVDATGHVAHEFPARSADSIVGPSVADREFFQQVQAGSAVVVSEPFRGRTDGAPHIAFAAPLRSPQGAVTGALLGLLDVDHGNFLGDLGRVRIGKEGYFILVERNDHPLIVLHPQRDLIATPSPGGKSHAIMVGALAGREGTVEGVSSLGVESLRTFRPLRSVPWVLVAVYPTADAYAGLRDRQRAVLAVGAALFVAAAVAAWLVTGALLRPLGRLRLVIGAHAQDPGLPIDAVDFGSAELAELAQAYNLQARSRQEIEGRLRASEQRVREIADNMPASIAYIDKDQRYTFTNARILGRLPSNGVSVIGHTLREVRGEAGYAEVAPYVARALGGEAVSFEGVERLADGDRHTQSQFVPDRGPSGEVRGFYKMTLDITAQKKAQSQQAMVEQRLREITDHLPALIAHLGRDERYDFLNATFQTWLGIDPKTALGSKMQDVIGAAVYATRHDKVQRCLNGETLSFEMDAATLLGPKALRIEYLPDFGPDGSVQGFYTFTSDVTELKQAQQSLSRLVRSDSLTGLSNRLQFEESMPLAMARCRRSGLAMALMFLDIDHFKLINDSFGHKVGDLLLKEIADRLKHCVRQTDLVARLGGDEFVIILEALHGEAEATRVAQAILEDVHRPVVIDGKVLDVTISIGIAFRELAALAAGEAGMLEQADAALYEAKEAGRGTFRFAPRHATIHAVRSAPA